MTVITEINEKRIYTEEGIKTKYDLKWPKNKYYAMLEPSTISIIHDGGIEKYYYLTWYTINKETGEKLITERRNYTSRCAQQNQLRNIKKYLEENNMIEY